MSKIMQKVATAKIALAPKKVLIVDNLSAHLEALKDIIYEKLEGNVEFKLEGTREVTIGHIKWADIVVISGGTGRSIEKNPQTFRTLVEKIITNHKPVVGICLGAQAIAVYYGAELRDIGVRRVGNIAIHLNPVLARLLENKEKFMVYEFHRWSIPEVSDPLVGLAKSKDGVEVFRHKNLPVWGLQFHPEVRRLDNGGHIIFESIIHRLSK